MGEATGEAMVEAMVGAVDRGDSAAWRRVRARGPLVTLGLVLVVLAGLVYLAGVRTRSGQELDEALKAWWLPARRTWGSEAKALTRLLGAPLLTVTVVLGLVVLVVRRRVAQVPGFLAVVVGGPAIAYLLKRFVIDRDVLVGGTFPETNTLPSGHGAVVAVAALAGVWLAARSIRPVALVAAGLGAAGAGVVILTAAVHRPSDVLASFLLMGGWTALVIAVVGRERVEDRRITTAAAVVGSVAGVLVVAGVLAAGRALGQDLNADTTDLTTFLGGLALVAGTGAGVVASVGWSMGDP